MAGRTVALDGSAPALRPCRFCHAQRGVTTGPKGPHHDGVRCADCGRHLGWLTAPAEEADVIEE